MLVSEKKLQPCIARLDCCRLRFMKLYAASVTCNSIGPWRYIDRLPICIALESSCCYMAGLFCYEVQLWQDSQEIAAADNPKLESLNTKP